jgi:Icc-related predicted phosphoesterase
MASAKKRLRLAAVADVHYNKTSQGSLQALFTQMANQADIFLLCGDLTNHGLPEEAEVLARDLTASVKIPILTVLGNHDYHAGKAGEIEQIMTATGIQVLDGEAVEIQGVGFAGVKGFLGGFGRRILEPWGEDSVKHLVHEAVAEALKLESALSRLRTPQIIAVLHYAPIQATVEGEPPEIFAFLGSSRLEEPLNRYRVTAAFHGHAHHGKPEGKTTAGIPVYNVALPVLRQAYPEQPPFRVLEVALDAKGSA